MKVAFCSFGAAVKRDYHGCQASLPASAHPHNAVVDELLGMKFVPQNTIQIIPASKFRIAPQKKTFLPTTISQSASLTSVLRAKWTCQLKAQTTEKLCRDDGIRSRALVGKTTELCSSRYVARGWQVKQRIVKDLPATKHCPLLGRACGALARKHHMSALQELSETTGSPESSIYLPFIKFAVQEISRRADFSPLPLKEEFRSMLAVDSTATIDNMAFTSSKIRLFRIASIQTGSSMQVLNVAGFARPELDLPIFCADFFSVTGKNIIVLDLNPLYNTDDDKDYKERYYDDLIPLANKYIELLPWGDKLTVESLHFFSPLVLWTKAQEHDLSRYLYPAFQDYIVAWLSMVDSAQPSVDALAIARNQEAQHRYITWRVTKDPGRPLLTKLYGEELSERYIKEFLFNGITTLGTKSFLDYFPEYRSADGSICKQRSMIGKSFGSRPWDKHGTFSPN